MQIIRVKKQIIKFKTKIIINLVIKTIQPIKVPHNKKISYQ